MRLSTHTTLALIVIFALAGSALFAQEAMRIHRKDKSTLEIPLSEIESITYSSSSAAVADDVLKDADGNVYKTIRIGNQIWMAENLRSSKYADGTPIPEAKDSKAWAETTSGAFCWYNNDRDSYDQLYGKLYNWHAVNSAKLAPPGWRVPTDEDWETLINALGGEKEAGTRMKVAGSIHWQKGDNVTNDSGFGALPGYRGESGNYVYIGIRGYYWSSTLDFKNPKFAWGRTLFFTNNGVGRNQMHKNMGAYVRFIKE